MGILLPHVLQAADPFVDHLQLQLQKEGFVGRQAFSEIPPRVEYYLTDDGKELWDAILPLLQWTMKREGFSAEGCFGNCRKRPGHH